MTARQHMTERARLVFPYRVCNIPGMKHVYHERIQSTSAVYRGRALTAQCYPNATPKHQTRPSCAPLTSHEARGHGAQRMLHARKADDVTSILCHMPVSNRMATRPRKESKRQRTNRRGKGGTHLPQCHRVVRQGPDSVSNTPHRRNEKKKRRQEDMMQDGKKSPHRTCTLLVHHAM